MSRKLRFGHPRAVSAFLCQIVLVSCRLFSFFTLLIVTGISLLSPPTRIGDSHFKSAFFSAGLLWDPSRMYANEPSLHVAWGSHGCHRGHLQLSWFCSPNRCAHPHTYIPGSGLVRGNKRGPRLVLGSGLLGSLLSTGSISPFTEQR